MRKYECMIVVRPDLPDEALERVKDRVVGTSTRAGALEITYQDWGRRKLAYPIKKTAKGTYLYYRFLGTGTAVSELERILKVTDEVLRYMTVKLADRVDAESFDFEAERKSIFPFNIRPREAFEPSGRDDDERGEDREERGDRDRDRDRDRGRDRDRDIEDED